MSVSCCCSTARRWSHRDRARLLLSLLLHPCVVWLIFPFYSLTNAVINSAVIATFVCCSCVKALLLTHKMPPV